MKSSPMNEPDNEQIQEVRKRIGSVLLGTGGIFSVLMFVDHSGLELLTMPAFWYRSRPMHLLICLGFFVCGLYLLRSQAQTAKFDDNHLKRIGNTQPLFQSVRFYSKANCPLCDDTLDILETYCDWMPEIEFVDITGDQQLEQLHGEWVPVIEIDGRVRFRGGVDPVLLQRLLTARQDSLEREQSR